MARGLPMYSHEMRITGRWYYTFAGQTFGPVTGAQLLKLAAEGRV